MKVHFSTCGLLWLWAMCTLVLVVGCDAPALNNGPNNLAPVTELERASDEAVKAATAYADMLEKVNDRQSLLRSSAPGEPTFVRYEAAAKRVKELFDRKAPANYATLKRLNDELVIQQKRIAAEDERIIRALQEVNEMQERGRK